MRRHTFLPFAVICVLAVASTVSAQPAPPWTGVVADEARSDLPAAAPAVHSTWSRAISGDGRFVVFSSDGANLVPGDSNDQRDVFLRDRHTGLLSRVSVASDGTEGNSSSDGASISSNGRHILFESCSSNFDPADTNNNCDIFIHDRELGTTVRANYGPNGEEAVSTLHHSNLSADGRYLVFTAGFTPGAWQREVWLRDRDADENGVYDEPGLTTVTQINQATVGIYYNLYDFADVAISHDGRWISYASYAFAPGGLWGRWLFLHDRVTLTTVRVDVPAPGRQDGNWSSHSADFSESGHLVYVSNGNNITNTEADFWYSDDVIVYDIATGVNTGVQLTHFGAPEVEYEWAPAISADGRFVVFSGVTWDYDPIENVYAVDRQTGFSYDISLRPDWTRDNDAFARPSISADGSAIAFVASTAMLVNGTGDPGVFVVTNVALSPPNTIVSGNGGTFTIDVTVPPGVSWQVAVEPTTGVAELSATAGVGPGTVDVTIHGNHFGESTREIWMILGSERVRFEQDPPPFVTVVWPQGGPPSGGTPIEIIGYGFVPGATVTIGGYAATDVTVVDSHLITAMTPAGVLGPHRLRVTNPNGDWYEYYFFYVDTTPPVVTPTIGGQLGQNGWYVSDVSVSWFYEDPETTVWLHDCVNPYRQLTDTVSHVAICRVSSDGGETIGTVDTKRDTVPPTLNIFPAEPATYFQGQVVPIAADCADATSGIASCTASQTGQVLNTSTVGTFTFSATAVDRAGHSTTKSTSYTVKTQPVIYLPEWSGVYRSTASLRTVVTASGSGAPLAGKTVTFFIAYVPVGTAVTSATGEALLTVTLDPQLGAGNHPVHVSFPGDASTLPFEAHGTLAIAKATPTLTWATPAFITERTPLGSTQLNATASVPGSFAYTPGFSTLLPPGTHTLTVNFAPADSANYNTASKSVSIKVKAYPVITWATPAPIAYPERVSWTQLNATGNPPGGSFVYSPVPGTLLDAGTHTLSVTFTPSNTADYVSETATVQLQVLKGTATITWWPLVNPITYPTPLGAQQLNATTNGDGSIAYSSPLGTVLTAGTHTLTATFTPNYPYNYHPATATKDIIVRKANPVVNWAGTLAPITYGTPLGAAQLYATSATAGTITYNPPAGTVLDAGTRTITATLTPDDTTNYNTVTVQKTIVVDKQTTTITWNNPAPIVYGTALSFTQLNAAPSQAGTLSYSPSFGAVLSAGTHTLSVTFTPTSPNYYGGSRTVTLVVEKRTPVITWSNPAPIVYGAALSSTQLNATKDVVSGTLTYNPALGTVLSAGNAQTLTVTYTPAAGQSNNYNPASATVTIDVLKLAPTITWTPASGITYGTPLSAAQLNATSNLAGTMAYSPGAGTILPAGTNDLTATFTPTDTVNHATSVQTRQIVVNKATPVLSWATPAMITYGTPLSPTQLSATADVPGTFTYSPAPGTVLDAGNHTITAVFTPDDQANYVSRSTTRSIDVFPAAPVITWPAPQPIVYGTPLSEVQLNATANVAGTFSYLQGSGLVLPAGTYTLSLLFTPESPNYHGLNATVPLVVEKATPVVTWPAPAPITYGTALIAAINATANVSGNFTYSPAAGTVLPAGTHELTATFNPSNNSYVSTVTTVSITVNKATPVIAWSSPKFFLYGRGLAATELDATANVPGSFVYSPAAGAVLNVGTHQLTVSFTPDDAANYTPALGTTSLVVGKANPQITWANPASITYGTPLSEVQFNATANVAGTFSYSPAAGTVLSVGTQSLSVNFTPDDSFNYFPEGKTVSIVVTKAAPVIAWANPAGITYGTALTGTQLNATANVGGSFTYAPPPGTVLAAGTHELSVTFTPWDTTNYSAVTSTASVVVGKSSPIITWANPTGITYGIALSGTQLNATANVNGSFVYSPASGTVLNAGSHTLSVTFTPDDAANYNGASADVSIAVGKAAPVITWANPAGITYGTALSGTQLNASASVNGSFVYSPAAGTVLGGGPQTLSVTFTPDDAANYTTATATVSLAVAKAAPVITWANPAGITYGTALSATQLNASANVTGSFAYSPAAGAVLGAGPQALSVTFTPDDAANYATATANVSIAVAKAVPMITWANPASITYGTGLSGTQLNATANVPGSFAYNTPTASELGVGTHELVVTFTPTDGDNYTTASRSVSIVITPAALTVRANNATKVYGEALPAFTATGTGFVNGDSMASLGGTLAFATSATATSAPGTYVVTPSGATSANYSITFATGTLTVTKAATSVTLTTTPSPSQNNQIVQLRAVVSAVAPGAGTATGTIEFRENGQLLGTATLVNGVATLNKSFKRGTHPLTATYAGNVNFTGSTGSVSHVTQ